jgi:glutathione S-transferase
LRYPQLFFLNAGVGPMQGQANHFNRYAPERIEYGVNRYVNETRRLYGVLDKHLQTSTSGYLVGDKCTIADIAHWGWVYAGFWSGVDIEEFPTLKAWSERMQARPGVEKGRHVPEYHSMIDLYEKWKADPKSLDDHAKHTASWVQKGMAEDAKK